MQSASFNGIEIYYEVYGSGIPVILISGLGYPAWEWHRMIPYLAARYQVIAFDNRGVGKSSKPAGPYTAEILAEDTVALLDHLSIPQAVVVGHSMGGFIAQALALAYPERVSKLVLCSTNFGGSRHIPITPEAMRVLSDFSSDPLTRFKNGLVISTAPGFTESNPEIIQAWLNWRAQNPIDVEGYRAQMGIGLALLPDAAAFESKLSRISAPTLILFGVHDKVVPPANAGLLQAQIPNSKVVLLSGAGHFFPIEKPEEASQAIMNFVN